MRAAELLIDRKAEGALDQCISEAEAFASLGDATSRDVWLAIGRAAQAMLNNRPAAPAPLRATAS
jgi:uncharacterized alpha-E superfamily protein